MSRLGLKSAVYHGDTCLGELDVIPATDQNFQFPNNEIRIRHISPLSERCPPLSILQTVASFSVRCKLESSSPFEQAHLINLHASCFYELKVSNNCLHGLRISVSFFCLSIRFLDICNLILILFFRIFRVCIYVMLGDMVVFLLITFS